MPQNSTPVTAVVGTCAPERAAYARRFADRTGRSFHTADRIAMSPDPVDEALALAPWSGADGAVIEFPAAVPVTEIIGRFADPEPPARLAGVICVVDATHVVDDLLREDYVVQRFGAVLVHRARAMATVTQIEYASTAVLTGWDALSTPDLSLAMALVSALAPTARIRLDPAPVASPDEDAPATPPHDRPGWVRLLNDEHDPHMTDPRVATLRYQAQRPLHPARLRRLLDEEIEAGRFGAVLRSVGFCRLATRPDATARWEHVGSMISLSPGGADADLAGDEELLAAGQDIAFIGVELDAAGLIRALDAACLTDAELTAGPAAWARFADPFPAWLPAAP